MRNSSNLTLAYLLLLLLLSFTDFTLAADKPSPAADIPIQESAPAQAAPSSGLPAKTPVDGEAKVFYTLSAGETISEKKLDSILKKLKNAGMVVAIREETRNLEVYRLIVECFAARKPATKKLAEISRRDLNAFLAHDENGFCVVAGSLMTEAAAIQEQKRMNGKGLTVKIVKAHAPLSVLKLNIGHFASLPEAVTAATKLSELGIDTTILKSGN